MAIGHRFLTAGLQLFLWMQPLLGTPGAVAAPPLQAAIAAHRTLPSTNAVTDLPTLWRGAAAVAYMKIQPPLPPPASLDEPGRVGSYSRYHAVVLEVFRRYLGKPESSTHIDLLLPGAGNEAAGAVSFPPGTELVAFMHWNGQAEAFETFVILPVDNGQVRSFEIEEIASGASLEFLLKKLRAMME